MPSEIIGDGKCDIQRLKEDGNTLEYGYDQTKLGLNK
jgi:hypothetical protein